MTTQVSTESIMGEIEQLRAQESTLIESFQAETQFSEQMRISAQILGVRGEIEKLETRYAKATGLEVPNEKSRLAQELKSRAAAALSVDAELMSLVRQIWAVQAERKLNSIVFGVDSEHPADSFTVSLEGGFVNRSGVTKSGAERKSQSLWLVPGGDGTVAKLGTKAIISKFGADYGQTVAWDSMTPEMRIGLRDAIVAGEGFAKYGGDDEEEDEE